MKGAPSGLSIIDIRQKGPVRVVYSAKQMPLGRNVQLVGLAPGVLSSSPLAKELEQEAEILAKLDHPNILKLYDLKWDESQLWLVLEEVDGPALGQLVPLTLSWQAVAAIGLDLCRALSHAHAQGEIHGKLFAGSVQLSRNGRTKLYGFGQMPRASSAQTEALDPTVVGGISPEGSVGQPVGPQSDIFALGVLLYELLTGRNPFGSRDDAHYTARLRNEREKPIAALRPELPAPFEHLITQALQKLPSDRPAGAESFASSLEAMIGSATLPIIRAELIALGLASGNATDPLEVKSRLSPTGNSKFPRLPNYAIPLITCALGALAAAIFLSFTQSLRPDNNTPPLVAGALASEDAVRLRVVASPWAHVLVDGTHRETTPFAHPLSLPPGKHVIRLEHPHAPPEERIVTGTKGQAVLLNVQMHVKKPLVLEAPTEVVKESSP